MKSVEELRERGLIVIESPFTGGTLARWNGILDPLFMARRDQGLRSYVTASELVGTGVSAGFFNPAMRALIRGIMPDAVLATFDCYETRGGMREAGIYDANTEWHRDILDLPGLRNEDLNYCSIFVYLSDVGPDSGPFEFRPAPPAAPLKDGDPTIRVLGAAGTTFAWNRSHFHRAAMNVSSIRRRVLKISIQHNHLQNDALGLDEYRAALAKIDPADAYLRFLFGAEHRSTHSAAVLPEVSAQAPGGLTGRATVNAKAHAGFLWNLYRRIRNRIAALKR